MDISKKSVRRVTVAALVCIFVIWLLNQTARVKVAFEFVESIFSPFLIGAGLAFVLNVPMRALENSLKFIKNKNWRRATALILTFLIIGAVISLILWILIPQLTESIQSLISSLPDFGNWVIDTIHRFLENNKGLLDWFHKYVDLESLDWSLLVNEGVEYLKAKLPAILDGAVNIVKNVSVGLFNAVISLVFAIYCLCKKETLARQARRLLYSVVPEKVGDEIVRVMRMTNTTFSGFIAGQCMEACILGSMFAVVMWIFKMPYIPLVSLLIGVTALVPIVGAFTGCTCGALLILVQNPIQAVWFVVLFLLVQQFDDNVIYPRVMGKSVGLPGMWVLLAVAVGGKLMGVAGMLIMIPLFSVAYTLLREFAIKRLEKKNIPAEKLMEQPPDLGEGLFTRLFKSKKKTEDVAETLVEEKPEEEKPAEKQEE